MSNPSVGTVESRVKKCLSDFCGVDEGSIQLTDKLGGNLPLETGMDCLELRAEFAGEFDFDFPDSELPDNDRFVGMSVQDIIAMITRCLQA